MTQITIIGNLTDSPDLRFTAQGKAVANFTVAESKRVKDGDGWKDGPSTFFLKNAERLAASPPPSWDGVVVFESK